MDPCFIGVSLAVEGAMNIREESNMTISLCTCLVDIGEGLERTVNISLGFTAEGFATQGLTNCGEICVIIMTQFFFYQTADFNIEDISIIFPSNSSINSTLCFIFTPVNDEIIEEDERFTFSPTPANSRDVYLDGPFAVYTIVIYDDDGNNNAVLTE